MQNNLQENLQTIRKRIEAVAMRAGRRAEEIKLIAVSKMHPTEVLRETVDAGIRVFGENKVQEAETKIATLGRENLEWHLIGHLQSNKARKAVQMFDVIHTLDSIELGERLERICAEENKPELSVLIQVDLGGEETKSGISKEDLPKIIEKFSDFQHVKLKGLMTLPPYFEDIEKVRPFFRELRELRDELLPEGELSMGMSHDFETAIEEGATMVRVGTAIFGAREYAAK